jgi:hypothetical protein
MTQRRDGCANRHAKREYGHRDDQLGRVAEYRFVIVGYGRFDHGAPRLQLRIVPAQRISSALVLSER